MSYIKLDRKISEWEWFTDGNMLKVWVYLLTHCNYKDSSFQGHPLNAGDVVIGRKMLAERLKMSEMQIRTCLSKLEKTKEITIKATNKYTIVSIVKWADYQCLDEEDNQQPNQPITNEQPTNNQQITTYKKYKKERKKEYIYLGEYKNVKMTPEELEKVKEEFPNDWQQRVERLSEYCASTGKSYKNYLATIRNWARKDKPKEEFNAKEKYKIPWLD